MPVLAVMGHHPLVNTYVLSAGVTILREEVFEARAAVRPAISHDVALSAQLAVTLQAAEVFHVPATSFRLCTLVCENNLWE